MTTLLQLRTKLNDEIAVVTDAETVPWTVTQRNNAIQEGYAELWRAGVYKDAKQDLSTVANQWVYALTSIRKLYRMELIDSASRVLERPRGIIEIDGSGAGTYQLRLSDPVASGYTLRVRGWSPFKSVFANDADTDDLPAEHNRIPIVKAKAILYRQQLAKFARWGEAQSIVPPMNVSIDALLGLIAQAEREFSDAVHELASQRPRAGVTKTL